MPKNISNIKDLIHHLQKKGAHYTAAFDDEALIRVAVNQVYVPFDHPLSDSDEVAFFPPMTGG